MNVTNIKIKTIVEIEIAHEFVFLLRNFAL